MLNWIALLIGILVWPELAFCIFLFIEGYPLLGILAIFCTFFSGKTIISKYVWPFIKGKLFPLANVVADDTSSNK